MSQSVILTLVHFCKLKCPRTGTSLIPSKLTMVVTDGGATRPAPRDGAVPLGRPIQSEPFLAGEALRGADPKPLIPGPNIAVIQLELSWTQNVWKGWKQSSEGNRVCAT